MPRENICHFIPQEKQPDDLCVINFVLETTQQVFSALKTEAVYKMHYFSTGHGFLHTPGKIIPVSMGDIFFSFPGEAFALETTAQSEYFYISFLGARGSKIMQQLGIDRNNCISRSHGGLKTFWQNSAEMITPLSGLVAESVLLFTFSHLAATEREHRGLQKGQPWAQAKKYLDDHFTDHRLCLRTMGEHLGYHPKYLSAVFKQHVGMGVAEYLNSLRIQHGCNLMAQGFTSIGDISAQSGFSDAQYFSKVFKKVIGVTPGQYIKEHK
ncbi:MAG: helix-turn-helix transcriptional regulator [Oscillospiraceae bacterium]|nr:helix-turn-helix transcriptional regulator [Oscillospiraceae bacterium]